MERLSTTENSSVLSTKKPLDVASTKGNKKITNNIVPIRILSLFPKKSNQPTSTQDLVEAAFGFLALLAVIAFVGIITLLKDLNTNEELPEVTAYPIVKEEVKTITAETKLEPVVDDDYLIASIVMAEAEGEEMVGKVAVASVILNRCENWDKTVSEVIGEPNQFAKGKEPNLDCLRAVEIAKDIRDLYPSDMLYFRNAHYHEFGCPFLVIGHHYFSTEKGINDNGV